MDVDISKLVSRKNLVGVFLVVLLVSLSLFITSFVIDSDSVGGRMKLILQDETISSNESTSVTVRVENEDEQRLNGTIVFEEDNQDLHISHPSNTSVTVNLLSGESVERRYNVRAVTDAYTSTYEIKASLSDQNTTLLSDSVYLTVEN